MSRTLIGQPSQAYETLQGGKYQANSAGEIDGVLDHHVADLVKAGCVDQDIAVQAMLAGVRALSGDGGKIIAGDGSIKSISGNFDAAGAAAAARAAAEAYADNGDAPTIAATLTTMDATANVVAASYTPSHNSLIHVEATFLARFQTGADGKTRKVTAAFLTDNAGAVTIVGTALGGDSHTTASATTATASVQTDGTVVQLVVTGIDATNIDWQVIGEVTEGP